MDDECLTAVMANYITEEGVVDMERLMRDDLGDLSVEDVMMAFIEKTTQDIVDLRVELKHSKKREEEVKLACKDIRRELVNVEITNDLLDTQLFEAEEREQIWYEMIQEEKSLIALQNCYSELRYNEASMLLPMGNGYKPITTKEEREVLGMGLRLSSSDTEVTKEARDATRSDRPERPRSAAQLTFKSDYGPIMSLEFPGPGKCPIPRINDDIIPQPRENSRTSLSPLQEMPEETEGFLRTSPRDAMPCDMELGEEPMEKPHNVSSEDDLSTEPDATCEDDITGRNVDETGAKSPTVDPPLSVGHSSDESQLNIAETPKVSEETLVKDGQDDIVSDAASAEIPDNLLLGVKSDSFEAERKSNADEGYISQISEKVSELGVDMGSASMDIINKKSSGTANAKASLDSACIDSFPSEVARASSPFESDEEAGRSTSKGIRDIPVNAPSPVENAKTPSSGLKNVQDKGMPDDHMGSRSMTGSISITNEPSGVGSNDAIPLTPRAPIGSPSGSKMRRRSAILSREAMDDGRRSKTPIASGSAKVLPPLEPLKSRTPRSPTKSPALHREGVHEIDITMGNGYRRAVIEGEQVIHMEIRIKPNISTSITEKRGPRPVSPQYIERAASPCLPDIQRVRKEHRLSARKSREVGEQLKSGPNVVDLEVPSYGIAGKTVRKEVLSPIPRVLTPNALPIGKSNSPTKEMPMGDDERNQNLNSKRAVRKFIDIDDKPVKLKKRNAHEKQEKESISSINLDSKGKTGRRRSLKKDAIDGSGHGKYVDNVDPSGYGHGSQHGVHLPVIGKEKKRSADVNLKHIPSPPQDAKPGHRRSFLPNINKK